ncbi:MAG: hypothetical protein JWL74_297 [Alphaproteobacteria bacterium]|jgi:hypothetical protein|nr:hypothetical protein [Alphaproteobacteria bacterium]
MTREEITAQVSDVRVAPGEWERRNEILSVEAPDMPREIAARLRQPQPPLRYCITPEQAAQPARVSDAIARPEAGCTMRGFSMSDGRMDGVMICREGSPGQVTTAMSGTYSPESFDYRSRIEMPPPIGDGVVRIEVRTSGRRVGPCPAQPPGEGTQ